MKKAYLAINPTEHITEDKPLLFVEVDVYKIDKSINIAYILNKDWRSIRDWGDYELRPLGYIWLFSDWAVGVEEITKLKERYENQEIPLR